MIKPKQKRKTLILPFNKAEKTIINKLHRIFSAKNKKRKRLEKENGFDSVCGTFKKKEVKTLSVFCRRGGYVWICTFCMQVSIKKRKPSVCPVCALSGAFMPVRKITGHSACLIRPRC